ncbi:DNA-binding protein [Lysobacter capsici]|uniref:DNA-binding protein n=1 Tax=Lysobacter capsici TaxID=435897 RepID=UPI000BBAFF02|nr:DNA-binding protein [Lysobacter capsici]ATE72751.1 DNA-binding protein [Lysobacter capsici]
MSLVSGQTILIGSRRSRLGKLIKSGGAGSVYLLPDDANAVAKIYHARVDPPSYTDRIEAMLDLRPHLPDQIEGGKRYVQIAWPDAVVRDERGKFAGFTMPALDVDSTSELEQVLQERQARAAGLPVGLGHKITLAANLAAVLAALHQQHHCVVDLKPVNLRFYRASLYIALLDCDGFSIQGRGRRYSAPQYTPDYLAPEYQAHKLDEAGEETQDRFALAVVIFQLLNFGIHPYSGKPSSDRVPTDIPGRIRERCYAYGLRANRIMAPSPVSAHASMPRELRGLFDRAFGDTPSARPPSSEWRDALRAYAQPSSGRLVVCGRNREHQHYAGQPCASCIRLDLLSKTARKAKPRPATQPQDLPRGWAAVMRTPVATPQPRPRPQPAPRRFGARPPLPSSMPPSLMQQQMPSSASTTRGCRLQTSRLVATARAAMILVVPLVFAALSYLLQGYYAGLRGAATSPLDSWMNQILLTLMGIGFVVFCYLFLVVLPRMIKNR